MALAVILLCGFLMVFTALTTAVQRTIRALGLLHPGDSEAADETGSQPAILLSICLRRLNAAFLLGMGVYLVISRASAWYYGAGIVALCWLGSLLIGSSSYLRPGSARMIGVLVTDLERRRRWYRYARDTVRLQAVEEVKA
jgi:hypothetical protein